jgi:uncharacterized protein YndB with AHSA1/START domain
MNDHSQRQVHELFIQTSAEKLWESLTNGDLTPAYFFGTVVKSSFERGAPIRFDLPDGTPTVDGVVLECEPRKRLVHTWKIRYDAALEGETSTVEWRLEPRGKACRVVAIHDFAQAPKTAAHLGEGQDGWSVVLSGLKTFLETGKPLDLPMAG